MTYCKQGQSVYIQYIKTQASIRNMEHEENKNLKQQGYAIRQKNRVEKDK